MDVDDATGRHRGPPLGRGAPSPAASVDRIPVRRSLCTVRATTRQRDTSEGGGECVVGGGADSRGQCRCGADGGRTGAACAPRQAGQSGCQVPGPACRAGSRTGPASPPGRPAPARAARRPGPPGRARGRVVVGDQRPGGVQAGEEVGTATRRRPAAGSRPRWRAGGGQPGQVRLPDDGNERLVGHASPRTARRSTRTHVRTSSRPATTTTARHCRGICPAWQRPGVGGDPAATLSRWRGRYGWEPPVSAPDRPAPPPPAEPDPERPETPPAGAPVGLAVGTTGVRRPAPTLPRLRRPSGYPPPLPHRWSRGEIALPVALALWLAAWIAWYLPADSAVQALDAALVDFAARDHRNDADGGAGPGGGLRRPAAAAQLGRAGHRAGRGRAGPVPAGARAARGHPAGALAGRHARRAARQAAAVRRRGARPLVRVRGARGVDGLLHRDAGRRGLLLPPPGPGPDRRADRGRRADRAVRRGQGGARRSTSPPRCWPAARSARWSRCSASACWCRTRSTRWAGAAPGPRTWTWTSGGRRSRRRWPSSSACGCAS